MDSNKSNKYENILKDVNLTNKEKVHKLLEWEPIFKLHIHDYNLELNDLKTYFMKPYVNYSQTKLWYDKMENIKDINKFINLETNKEILIDNNYIIYFKMIIYCFVYGFNMNIQVFQNRDATKKFINIVKNIFVNTEIKQEHLGNNIIRPDFNRTPLKRIFDFLFFNSDKYGPVISKIGIQTEIKEWQNIIDPLYIKLTNVSNTPYYRCLINKENFDIEDHFIKTVKKYNKSIKLLLSFNDIIKEVNLKSTSQSISSSSDDSDECHIQYINSVVKPEYKDFKKEVKKAYKKYLKPKKEDENYDIFIKKLQEYNKRYNNTSKVNLIEVDEKNILKSFFIAYISKLKESINIFRLNNKISIILYNIENKNGKEIKEYSNAIDYGNNGGVSEQIFENISKELIEKKVFVKPDMNIFGSEKYFINPLFKLEDLSITYKDIEIISDHKNINKKELIDKVTIEFWTFMGNLIEYMILYEYKLSFQLSSYILSGFLTKKTKRIQDSVVLSYNIGDLFYFLQRDFNEFTNMLITIMNSEKIEEACKVISLDTFINLSNRLDKINDYILKENKLLIGTHHIFKIENDEMFINYIYNISFVVYIYNCLKNSSYNQYNQYVNFFNGISDNITKGFNVYKISLDKLDNELFAIELSDDDIDNFIQNIIISSIKHNNEKESYDIKERVNNFLDLIRLQFKKSIYDSYIDKKERVIFVAKLLQFWSGTGIYKPKHSYILNVVSEIDKKAYPSSHTCFKQIDIPLYEKYEDFWEKISKVINDGHYNQFQIAGREKYKKP